MLRALFADGWRYHRRTPISLFTCMMETRTCSMRNCFDSLVDDAVAAPVGRQTLHAQAGWQIVQHRFVLGLAGDDVNLPFSDKLAKLARSRVASDSVAPEVKTISRGSAPTSSAIWLRAISTASSACQPKACERAPGFPRFRRVRNCIIFSARGSTGVVAGSRDKSVISLCLNSVHHFQCKVRQPAGCTRPC